MIEEQGGRQAQAGGGAEAVAQLDGHERVEAELLERTARFDGLS